MNFRKFKIIAQILKRSEKIRKFYCGIFLSSLVRWLFRFVKSLCWLVSYLCRIVISLWGLVRKKYSQLVAKYLVFILYKCTELPSTCQINIWQVDIIVWQVDVIFWKVDIMILQVNIIIKNNRLFRHLISRIDIC